MVSSPICHGISFEYRSTTVCLMVAMASSSLLLIPSLAYSIQIFFFFFLLDYVHKSCIDGGTHWKYIYCVFETLREALFVSTMYSEWVVKCLCVSTLCIIRMYFCFFPYFFFVSNFSRWKSNNISAFGRLNLLFPKGRLYNWYIYSVTNPPPALNNKTVFNQVCRQ